MKRRAVIAALRSAAATWPLKYAVALAMIASWPAPSEAHDIYAALKDRDGGSCCSGRDCRPAYYRVTADGVKMLVAGKWIVVPNETIQYRTLEGDTGETAGGHWCGSIDLDLGTLTFCTILPPSAASLIKGESSPKQKPPVAI